MWRDILHFLHGNTPVTLVTGTGGKNQGSLCKNAIFKLINENFTLVFLGVAIKFCTDLEKRNDDAES